MSWKLILDWPIILDAASIFLLLYIQMKWSTSYWQSHLHGFLWQETISYLGWLARYPASLFLLPVGILTIFIIRPHNNWSIYRLVKSKLSCPMTYRKGWIARCQRSLLFKWFQFQLVTNFGLLNIILLKSEFYVSYCFCCFDYTLCFSIWFVKEIHSLPPLSICHFKFKYYCHVCRVI